MKRIAKAKKKDPTFTGGVYRLGGATLGGVVLGSRGDLHSLTRALRKERPTKPRFVLVPEERVRFQRTGFNKPRACVVSKVSDDGGEALLKVPWADEVNPEQITETEQEKEKAPLDTHWHDKLDLEPEPEEDHDGEALKSAALAVDAAAVGETEIMKLDVGDCLALLGDRIVEAQEKFLGFSVSHSGASSVVVTAEGEAGEAEGSRDFALLSRRISPFRAARAVSFAEREVTPREYEKLVVCAAAAAGMETLEPEELDRPCLNWAAFVRLYAVCLRSFVLKKEAARIEAEVRELRGALHEGREQRGEQRGVQEAEDDDSVDLELPIAFSGRARSKLQGETRQLEREVRKLRLRVEAQKRHSAALRLATKRGTAEAEAKLARAAKALDIAERKRKKDEGGEKERKHVQDQMSLSAETAFRQFDLDGGGGGGGALHVDNLRISARDLFDCLALVRGDALAMGRSGASFKQKVVSKLVEESIISESEGDEATVPGGTLPHDVEINFDVFSRIAQGM